MSAATDTSTTTALDELRRVCAPYVGMLVANGDAALANHLQTQFKSVSQELRQDETSNEALQRQLAAAHHKIEGLTQLARDLSQRLMAANGELRREVARADLAEGAVRAQVFASRSDSGR